METREFGEIVEVHVAMDLGNGDVYHILQDPVKGKYFNLKGYDGGLDSDEVTIAGAIEYATRGIKACKKGKVVMTIVMETFEYDGEKRS